MERLTKHTPKGNFETMMNYVYGRDGWATLRSDGEHDDVPLTEWSRSQCKCRGCDVEAGEGPEEIDQAICDCAFLQPDCPVFLAYTFASQAVHLRSRLVVYEDICFDATGKERITVEELSALVKAREEGRVVVLRGDHTEADGEEALRTAMYHCGVTNNPVTRYTADAIAEKLTRAEEEAAIERDSE